MSLKLYEENDIAAIADAIRGKVGGGGTYSVSASQGNTKMATAVNNIPSGGGTLGTKNISANGTYDADDDGYDGYSSVTVNVTPTLQSKTVTENGTVTPDAGYEGLASVIVNVSGGGGSLPANIKTGTFTVAADAASQTINHGGSVAPRYIFWMPVVPLSGVTAKYTVGGFFSVADSIKCAICNTVSGALQTNVSYATVADVTNTTFDVIERDTSYPIKAGDYIFFAWFDN